MSDLFSRIEAARALIATRFPRTPKVGIILGTGLGAFAQQITDKVEIPYGDIPHMPQSTVESHAGQLVCGSLSGLSVVVRAIIMKK